MNDQNEIDMKKYFALFKVHQNKIIKTFSFCFVLASIYILFSEPLYKSYITIYPAGELSDSSNILSDFSGIAETFGFSDLKVQSSYYIPDIINSYSLKKSLVLKKWKVKGYNNPIDLIEYFGINNEKKSTISKIKRIFIKNEDSPSPNELDLDQAVNLLSTLINVDEKISGLIQVNIYFGDPYLSADIANFISQYVIDFVESEQRKQANLNRQFLDGRVFSASIELNLAEEKFTKFLKTHPISIETPEILQEKARLIRNIEVNQQVYITLRQQLEIAKIEESKSRLFINRLDDAYPAMYPTKPNKILIYLMFILLGVFSNLCYIVWRYDTK
tara:strand:+ start:39 stop:1031 length:993 start_codon:yes stop_codon:yes gene_type:complete